jgi:hypothetical protein
MGVTYLKLLLLTLPGGTEENETNPVAVSLCESVRAPVDRRNVGSTVMCKLCCGHRMSVSLLTGPGCSRMGPGTEVKVLASCSGRHEL